MPGFREAFARRLFRSGYSCHWYPRRGEWILCSNEVRNVSTSEELFPFAPNLHYNPEYLTAQSRRHKWLFQNFAHSDLHRLVALHEFWIFLGREQCAGALSGVGGCNTHLSFSVIAVCCPVMVMAGSSLLFVVHAWSVACCISDLRLAFSFCS